MKLLPIRGIKIIAILTLVAGLACLLWQPGSQHKVGDSAPSAERNTVEQFGPATSFPAKTAASRTEDATNTISAPAAQVSGNPQPPALNDDDEPSESQLSRWQFGRAWGRETNQTLRAFSKWVEGFVATTNEVARAELLDEGTALAIRRRPVLKALIETDPAAALAVTVPARWRQQLPGTVVTNLEERVSGRGDLLVLGATPEPTTGPGFSTIQRTVTLAGRTFGAHVFGRRQNLQTRPGLSLHGIALEGKMAVSDSPLRLLEPGEAPDPVKPAEDTRCPISRKNAAESATVVESGSRTYWLCQGGHIERLEQELTAADGETGIARSYQSVGPKRLLVMLADFPDLPGGPTTPEKARAKMIQVNEFFRANSFSQMWFSDIGTTPVLRMPQPRGFYTSSAQDGAFTLLQDARAAALATGFDSAAFEFDLVAFAGVGFNWGGLGYVGWKGAWVQGDLNVGIAAHELGHNLGLWHAGFWTAPDGIGLNGNREEYGNPFDVMGNSQSFPNGHFSANFKYQLGWLPESAVVSTTASGTVRIYAMDAGGALRPERKYALQVAASVPVLGLSLDYWVDYRSAMPRLNGLGGATMQWGSRQSAEKASLLIDTTPSSPAGKRDATIAPGETFTDSARGVVLTVVGQGGAGADAYLDVTLGPPPPPPSLMEALDFAGATWSTGGAAGWQGQRGSGHDGIDGARSGTIADGQTSWVEAAFTGPGTISFWWKASSEARFDRFRLLIDGTEVEAISGQVDWRLVSHSLSAGTHLIRWDYRKDQNQSVGQDRAWLDAISFTVDPANSTRYVDTRNTRPTPDGSLLNPYRTVSEGIAKVPTCGTLRIRSGIYRGPMTLTKCMKIESYGGRVVLGDAASSGTANQIITGLSAPQPQPNGAVKLSFFGEPGREYEVLSSVDLIAWEPWKRFVADEAAFDLIDTSAATAPRRFFQLLPQ